MAVSTSNCFGIYYYGEKVTDTAKPEITMQWINEAWCDQVYNDYAVSKPYGLVFFIEERRDLFCNDPRERIEVKLIDFSEKQFIDWDNYQLALLVTGFPKPKSTHPLWHKPLNADRYKRGDIVDGNGRTVYLYVPDELGLGFSAGITVHDTNGSWSCWENHAFEVEAQLAPIDVLPNFTEKFAYITETNTDWGIHGNIPCKGESKVFNFADGAIVSVPLGGHYTVAMPGRRLAYVWALMGGAHKEYVNKS